jgi:hypothetical protein
MPVSHYHLGRSCERIVFQVMEANLPHEACNLRLLPGSGRSRGGDIACAATKYEVKSTRGARRPTVYAGIPIYCFVSDRLLIEFPFRDMALPEPPENPRIEVCGHFCPAKHTGCFPHIIIIPQSGLACPGGTGVLIGNLFVHVDVSRCPLRDQIEENRG